MTKPAKKLLFDGIYIAAVIGIALTVWAISAAVTDDDLLLPDIGSTFAELWRVLKKHEFWSGLGGTLLRCVISYGASIVLAAVLFYFCSAFYPVMRMAEPVVSALRTLPTMAVSLILAIWAGAIVAPVILGILVIVPMLYSALRARTATQPVELIEISRICGASRYQTFCTVTLPYAAAALPESLATAFSFNIKIILAAEILMQTTGLGMLMSYAGQYSKTAMLIAYVVISVAIAVACEYGLRFALKRMLKRFCD